MKDDFDWIVTQLREAEKDDGWPPWAVLAVWLLMAAATSACGCCWSSRCGR